jgi:hypothetical protein
MKPIATPAARPAAIGRNSSSVVAGRPPGASTMGWPALDAMPMNVSMMKYDSATMITAAPVEPPLSAVCGLPPSRVLTA